MQPARASTRPERASSLVQGAITRPQRLQHASSLPQHPSSLRAGSLPAHPSTHFIALVSMVFACACSGGATAPARSQANGSGAVPAGDQAPNRGSPPSAAPTTTSGDAAHPAAGPKVAFLGDSISAGLHLPADRAFPSILHDRLVARGLPFQLLNAGVSGDTTAGGLRRANWILKQTPEIVVIELGANDSMRGQPIASIEQNLRGIVDKVRGAGATPLLLGMRIPTSYGQEYAAQFEAIYPRVAQDMNLAFVPFFMAGVAGVPDQNLEDGIHPTPAGHIKLAETCEEALAKLVSAASEPKPQAGPTTEH